MSREYQTRTPARTAADPPRTTESFVHRFTFIALLALLAPLAAAQVPPELPADGLVLYLEADSIDADDDAPIERWKDRSGNAHDAVQADASKRPTLVKAGIAGRPTVRFDAREDGMPIADGVALGDRFTVVVVDAYSGEGDRRGATLQARGHAFNVGRRDGRVGVARNASVNDTDLNGYDRLPGSYDVTVAVADGHAIECYVNGREGTYRTVAPQSPGTLALAAAGHRGEGANADVAAVLVYDRPLAWHERRAIERHFMQRYAVPTGPRMRDVRLRNADTSVIVHFDRAIAPGEGPLREAVALEPAVAAVVDARIEGDTLIATLDKPLVDARFTLSAQAGAVRDPAGQPSAAFATGLLGDLTVRMNVAYSPAASAQLGGKLAENVATHVNHMNAALRNSEVPIQIEVAHVYIDPTMPDVSSGTVIENFRRNHATWHLMNRYGADVAVAISGYRNCGGRAYRGYPKAPFAALAVSCGAADGRSVFAHESGHIFGADHDLGYCIGTNYRITIPAGVVRSREGGAGASPAISATKFTMPAEWRDAEPVAASITPDRRSIRVAYTGSLQGFAGDAKAAVRLSDSADGPFAPLGDRDAVSIPADARDVVEIALAEPRGAGDPGSVWVMIEPRTVHDFGGQLIQRRAIVEAPIGPRADAPRLLYTSMAEDRHTMGQSRKATLTLVFDRAIDADAARLLEAIRFSSDFGASERPLGEGGAAVVPANAPHTLVVTVPNPPLEDRHTLLPSGARNRIPGYSNPRTYFQGMPMGDVNHDNAAVMTSLAETYARLRPDTAAARIDAPTASELAAKRGAAATTTITIANDEPQGGRTVAFDATSDRPWLTATPATGDIAPGASVKLTIRADATTVEAGEHAGTLTVTHSGGWAKRSTMAVKLRVSE